MAYTESPLFDGSQYVDPHAAAVAARNSDPPETHAAARDTLDAEGVKVGIVGRESAKHRLLAAYNVSPTALTDHEAADRATRTGRPEGTRRRCSDLRVAGYIVQSGTVTDPETGAAVAICHITERGRAVLGWLARHPDEKRYAP